MSDTAGRKDLNSLQLHGHVSWGAAGESCREEVALPLSVYHRLYWAPYIIPSASTHDNRSSKTVGKHAFQSRIQVIYRSSFDDMSDKKMRKFACFYFTDAVFLNLTRNNTAMAMLSILAQPSHEIIVEDCSALGELEKRGKLDTISQLSNLDGRRVLQFLISQMVSSMLNGQSYSSEKCAKQGLALAYLNEHCMDTASVPEMALLAGMSEAHFSRCFTQHMGITPARCMREFLFARVRKMLLCKAREESLVDIAMLCGFSGQAYFTRAFKARFGMTPGVYKKLLSFQ